MLHRYTIFQPSDPHPVEFKKKKITRRDYLNSGAIVGQSHQGNITEKKE